MSKRHGTAVLYWPLTQYCPAFSLVQMEWRNGWFVQIAKEAVARGLPDPCPLHTAWLTEVGALK